MSELRKMTDIDEIVERWVSARNISKSMLEKESKLNHPRLALVEPVSKPKKCKIKEVRTTQPGTNLINQVFGSPAVRKLITVKELSEMISVPPKTIYGWIYRGIIQTVRVGQRLIRFDLDYINQEFLQKKDER